MSDTGRAIASADGLLKWPLQVAPMAASFALGIWLFAAAAGGYSLLLSVLDGAVLRTMAAVFVLFALAPAAFWLLRRRRTLTLRFVPGLGWHADDWGDIETPQLVLDGGRWMCLSLNRRGVAGAAQNPGLPVPVYVPVCAMPGDDARWSRLRQLLLAARSRSSSA